MMERADSPAARHSPVSSPAERITVLLDFLGQKCKTQVATNQVEAVTLRAILKRQRIAFITDCPKRMGCGIRRATLVEESPTCSLRGSGRGHSS
jgi:hypothetical protein